MAQVGIGTTTPNASLDIIASNQATPANTDGILIPRVDEFSAVNPGASQDGILVYATGIGTPIKGFYYWDNANTTWSPFLGNVNSDFYQEGASVAAANVNDNIYRMGNIAIGKNTATALLDIENSADSGNGVLVSTTGTGSGGKYGIYNDISTVGTGSQFAVYNDFTGVNTSPKYGVYNKFSDTQGFKYGSYSTFSGTSTGTFYGSYTNMTNTSSSTKYGTYNRLSGFTGGGYGSYNYLLPSALSTGAVYGVYGYVSSSGTGIHTGVYGNAYGDGNRAIYGENTHANGHAGYFNGIGYFSRDLGVGISSPYIPAYRLDVEDIVFGDYVAQVYNRGNSTSVHGIKVKLGYAAPTSTNYYIGFFDGADTVNGRIQGTGVGVSYQTLSDQRLKTNIKEVKNALGIINKIHPKNYEYKELRGKIEMGFLAQELQPVYPQAVSGSPDSDVTKEPMMVDYSRLTPLLTAGIKELNEKVEVLTEENKMLKEQLSKYEQLEKRLQTLEQK